MKKIFSVLCASVVAMSAVAANPSDLKVYINPGHGGYDSDDRVMTIHPFADGDTATFAESKSNLGKGFRLRELLWEKGYNVEMSRVRNTTDDDLGLSTIVALSNKSGADLFLSIHSNATGVVNRRNFPLILFRGYDGEAQIPGSLEWATYINQHLLTNESTVWTSTSLNVRGDWSFQPSWGQQGYGVLRGQTVTSVLSEGSFHDYIPETYRLLNSNFHWIEAWNFRKAANQYFGIEGVEYGAIAGRINDERVLRSGDFKMYDDDLLAPVHNVKVELYDAEGTKVAECVTDELYNGIYAFRKVNPGNYKLKFVSDTHYGTECNVTVVADKINLLSHGAQEHFKTNDWEEGISDEEMKKILENVHKLPYGDILCDFFSLLLKMYVSHVHPWHGMKPVIKDPISLEFFEKYGMDKNVLEKKLLSENIGIN